VWPSHIPRRVPPPPGSSKSVAVNLVGGTAKPEPAAMAPGDVPIRWGRTIVYFLLFLLVALGRHYERELGQWLESMFGS
jgi:hypothetical protein